MADGAGRGGGAGLPSAAAPAPSRAQPGSRARVRRLSSGVRCRWVPLNGEGGRARAGSAGLGRGFRSHVTASGDSCAAAAGEAGFW